MDKAIKKYIEELRTTDMKQITNSGFLSVEAYSCLLGNGRTIKREKILKNKIDGSASIVLPLTVDNKVILAIEPRVFTKETVDIGVPAGYIEEGEEAVDAARRELLEETGYTSDQFINLGSFYQDQGCSAAYNHYFLALNCRKIKDQNLDEGEFIKYFLAELDEVDEFMEEGLITGLNSAYAIEKGKRLIKERKI